MRIILLATVLAVGVGCGLREVENIQTPYVASEYLPYAQPGTARIAGGVADGRTMTCTGMDVLLAPATAHTREAIGIVKAGKLPSARAIDNNRVLLKSTIKEADCDAQGTFAFDRLAAGTWILVVGLRTADDSMSGAMVREVTLAAGEDALVAFADGNFVPR
jgi:hypothetical protein